MKYKFLEHTADVMFEAYGSNLNELFENVALATFEVQVDFKSVVGRLRRKVKLKNEDLKGLLFDFLEELIYLKDAKYMVFKKFKVKIKKNKNGYSLDAVAEGDKIRPDQQILKTDVKAPTLHLFNVEKVKKGYKAVVILDI